MISYSQQNKKNAHSGEFTLLTGLVQPIVLRGVNLAGTYFTNRVLLEYSHGMFLRYPNFLRKDDNAAMVYSPWSTGMEIGYRINPKLDIRAEAKAHRYLVKLVSHNRVAYTVYSLGVGVYSRRYMENISCRGYTFSRNVN